MSKFLAGDSNNGKFLKMMAKKIHNLPFEFLINFFLHRMERDICINTLELVAARFGMRQIKDPKGRRSNQTSRSFGSVTTKYCSD